MIRPRHAITARHASAFVEQMNGVDGHRKLVVEDDIQQATVHALCAVIADDAHLSKIVHKKLTRDRVVPIISANVSWLILGSEDCG